MPNDKYNPRCYGYPRGLFCNKTPPCPSHNDCYPDAPRPKQVEIFLTNRPNASVPDPDLKCIYNSDNPIEIWVDDRLIFKSLKKVKESPSDTTKQ